MTVADMTPEYTVEGDRWIEMVRQPRSTSRPLDLRSQVVRLPVPDPLFDRFLCREISSQDVANELGQFGVAGESQRDELLPCELVRPTPQILGQCLVHPQPHLETDHTILNRQRH